MQMEEVYLSSDSVRLLTQITRLLIMRLKIVLKMTNPLILQHVFEVCADIDDAEIKELFDKLKYEMMSPSTDDSTTFVFYASQELVQQVTLEYKAKMPQNKPKRSLFGRQQRIRSM